MKITENMLRKFIMTKVPEEYIEEELDALYGSTEKELKNRYEGLTNIYGEFDLDLIVEYDYKDYIQFIDSHSGYEYEIGLATLLKDKIFDDVEKLSNSLKEKLLHSDNIFEEIIDDTVENMMVELEKKLKLYSV